MKIITLFAISILLLSGCKSTKINNIAAELPASHGVITGSMAWPKEGRMYSRLVFKFRSTQSRQEYSLEVRPSFKYILW